MLRAKDCEAILAIYTMLAMTVLTQIPKRFMHRVRPFAAGRAECFSNVTTSCFPSRAVVGAVVFVNLAESLVHDSASASCMPRWFPSWSSLCLIIACALLASLCRIVLGVHYASDCVGGFLLGVIVNLIGTALARAHVSSCGCNKMEEPPPPLRLTMGSGIVLVVLIGASVATVLILLLPPLTFFRKTLHAFSTLFVALIFSLVFLCPAGGQSYLRNDDSATGVVPPGPFHGPALSILLTCPPFLFTFSGRGDYRLFSLRNFLGHRHGSSKRR